MKPTRKLSNQEMDVLWERLIDSLEKANSKKRVAVLIVATLGPEERVMMAKRLMIGVLLLSDWKPRQIAELIKVSMATVYKFRHTYDINPAYRELLKAVMHGKVKPPDESSNLPANYLGEVLNMIIEGKRNRSKLLYTEID